MSKKFFIRSVMLCLFIVVVVFLLRAIAIKPPAGCMQQGDAMIVRFDGSCETDDDAVYKIPLRYNPTCLVHARRTSRYWPSSDSYASLTVPASELVPASPADEKVTVELRRTSCAQGAPTALIEIYRQDKTISAMIVDEGDGRHRIAGLSRAYNKSVIYDATKKDFFVVAAGKASPTDGTFDLFYNKDQAGSAEYVVKCYGWNGECHADINTHHLGEIAYPAVLASFTHEIMPKAIALTEGLRVK